jgi:beta-mannosidase
MEKRMFDLCGSWEFREYPESARRMRDLDNGQWMKAKVPSSIYTCLIEAGCFSRFDLDANPEDFGWISEREWIFRRRFDLDECFCSAENHCLVFEGLDTITQVWLNDKLIGKTENMFIPHRLEVNDRLHPGSNTLMVKFLPATAHAERMMLRYGKLSDYHYGDPRRSYIRKAQYQFGSVLGPALPGCGIFRPIQLEAYTAARIADVCVRTIDCNEHYADIRIAVCIQRTAAQNNIPLSAHLAVHGGGLDIDQTLSFGPDQTEHVTVIRIDRPIFWWPVGLGVPHLYKLTAELKRLDGALLDRNETDFGIRTIRLHRGKELPDQAFHFEINDKPLYIKGANWMPLSMFPGTQTPQDYEHLLTSLKQAHFNMLRVWGGGYYEDPVFYRLCDKLGILVWQDFLFASAYYPDRQWFTDRVRAEARSIICRLRNHACLALWCGNSRIDHLHETGRLGEGRKFYGRAIYQELLPGVLGELDPDRDYLPTTPFSEDSVKDKNNPTDGTCHHWDVWNTFASTRDYLFEEMQMPRFLCEFGMQSLPSIECIKHCCPSSRLYSGSEALEKHDYQADGDGRIARYSAELFRPPQHLYEQIEQSQLAQARAVKLCVEHLRANNHINSGLLLWTANDCAPAAGFSAIDFTDRPKALYYYARRFFAPVLVTLVVEKNTWLRAHLKGAGIVIINDSPNPLTATVHCRCLDLRGQTLDKLEYPVAVGPFSKTAPRSLPRSLACPQTPNRSLLHLEVVADSGRIAENTFAYLPDKHIDWPAASVDIQLSSGQPSCWTVQLSSTTILRDLTVVPPVSAVLEDNCFDLFPAQPKRLKIHFTDRAPSLRIPVTLHSIPCGLI